MECDVCLIGAGAAGLVMAEMLAADGTTRVVIVEAGPEHFKDRKEPYRVRSVVREHLGVNDGRVTAFGGATNTWGGGLIRLTAPDFEAIDGRPDTAWPIPFREMEPHYDAVERLLGVVPSSRGPDREFFETGEYRVHRRDIPVLSFRRKNFARLLGPGLRARPNVTILCDTRIGTIRSSPERGVEHLDLVSADGAKRRLRAGKYVITAGLVNSNLLAARFLSASGIDPASRGVGRCFHDHVSFHMARLHPKSAWGFSRRFGYLFERGLMYGEHFDVTHKGRRAPGVFLHLAFDMATSSVLRPVREVLNAVQQRTLRPSAWPSVRELLPLVIGVPRLGVMRYLLGRLFLDRGTRILATIDLEQVPDPGWVIGGTESGCEVRWDIAAPDVEFAAAVMPVFREVLSRLQRESAFDVEWMMPDPAQDPAGFAEYVRETSVDTLHSSGGLRMGAGADAAVDPDLRLRGVPNVHVVSSAVFPRVGTSNPTLTILALGHRWVEQYRRGVG